MAEKAQPSRAVAIPHPDLMIDEKLADESQPYGTVDSSTEKLGSAERQAALQRAMDEDPGYPAFSRRGMKMLAMVLVICCCSGDSGFDSTVMSAINSMVQYQQYFGLSSAGSKTGILAAFIPTAYLPDKLGRRWCMFLGNMTLIIGAMITANATSSSMFIGGRFLTGLGCSTAATPAKSYLVEITAPNSRGRWLGLLNSFYYVGQLTASGMSVATGRYNSDLAWRLPIYIQAVPAAVNAFFVFFLPESPRWLYSWGHTEKATQILANLHSRDADVNSPLVRLEIEEIKENLSLNGADKRWWDFRTLFSTAAERYRMVLVAIVAIWGQLSGNGLVTYFLTVLLEQAGITSPDRQRVLNFVNSVTSMIGALTGTAIVDHVGRRKLLLISSVSCCIGMSIIAGLLSDITGKQMRATAGISFIYLFMVFFSFGWTPMQALYPAEVLAYESRSKGLACYNLIVQASSCINTFAMPVALERIAWKTYLIFVVFDILGVVVIYFLAVETKKLTLEELDAVFNAPRPRKYSTELFKAVKAQRQE